MSNDPLFVDDGPLPYDTTFYVRDNCICLHMQRAARVMARYFDEALRPADLTNGQFSLLMSLNRPAPPTMGEIADVLTLDRSTLTANLKPLQRRGLLTITPDPEDKRTRRVALTPDGHSVLARAYPLWQRAMDTIEDSLDGGLGAMRNGLRMFS